MFLMSYMNESLHHESPKTSGTRLRYGPDVFRLIESPDFRAHYEPGVSPAMIPREQGPAGRVLNHGVSGVAEGALLAAG